MQIFKKKHHKLVNKMKKKQTHRYRKQTSDYQLGEESRTEGPDSHVQTAGHRAKKQLQTGSQEAKYQSDKQMRKSYLQ